MKKTVFAIGMVLSAALASGAYASPSIEPLVQESIVNHGNHLMFCAEYIDMCSEISPAAPVKYNATQLEQVNRSVNAQIKYKAETKDVWSIAPKAGDCEDYALTKMVELLEAGYPRAELHLTMVLIKATGEKHMVLTVETTEGTFVLDNRSKEVARWDAITEYKWIAVEQFGGNDMLFKRINNFWNVN